MTKEAVSSKTSAETRCFYQHGVKGKELLRYFPKLSKATVYRHVNKEIGVDVRDERKLNKGRPRKLSKEQLQLMDRKVPEMQERQIPFSSKDIQASLQLNNVSNRTVRRAMRRQGYQFLDLRRKGLLMKDDLPARLGFAERCTANLPNNFWKEGISMYFDGTYIWMWYMGLYIKTSPTDVTRKFAEYGQNC